MHSPTNSTTKSPATDKLEEAKMSNQMFLSITIPLSAIGALAILFVVVVL